MLNFEPIQYLTLAFSSIIFYSYQKHYRTSLISSTGERNFFVTICFGFVAVGSALSLQIGFQKIGIKENLFNIAFFYSAFLEELVKCLIILLVLWINRITEVLYDGIFYGVVLGGTFGFVENMIYTSVLPFWPMMLRTITSSTLHLLNGGVFGYFCMKFLFTKESYRYKFLIQGFFFCYISHAIYNYAGFTGGKYLMLLAPLLVHNFIFVEFLSAFARSSLPKFTLDLIKLSIQDYELIRRYTKYELWLYNEQKLKRNYVNLFQNIQPRKRIYIAYALFIGIVFMVLYIYFPGIRKLIFKEILLYEYISIFIIYPFMIAVSILFAGLLNPDFFQRQILQVPLFSFLDARTNNHSETTVIYYLTLYGFYVSFINPEKFQGELDLNFTIGKRVFNHIKGHAIWINENKGEPTNTKSRFSVSGALIRFNEYPIHLILYWNWARWTTRFRNLIKSLDFNNDRNTI